MLCLYVENWWSPIGVEHRKEEGNSKVKPTEDQKEVSLDDNILGWTTRIGTQAGPLVRKELAFFLKNNQDIFTWSHEDMLGISLNTMVHKLNVCPSFPLVRQKKKVSAQERDKAIA